ncbi:MAG: LytTR family DNA-binding domain-containing protein [Flavobacteriales bacterium]
MKQLLVFKHVQRIKELKSNDWSPRNQRIALCCEMLVRSKIIPLKDLHYLVADDDYVKLHTSDGSYMRKITLTHYENRLPEDQFVRIHRSYLVNVAQITGIEPYEKTSHVAKLKTGEKLQVSKAGYQRLKEVLGIWLRPTNSVLLYLNYPAFVKSSTAFLRSFCSCQAPWREFPSGSLLSVSARKPLLFRALELVLLKPHPRVQSPALKQDV